MTGLRSPDKNNWLIAILLDCPEITTWNWEQLFVWL